MKKQYLNLLTFLVLIAAFAISFTACGLTHQHTFASKWSSDETYHWHAATCEHTNEIADKATHTMVDGVCSECSYIDNSVDLTAFQYTVWRGEATITGYYDFTQTVITIPSYLNNYRVVRIAKEAFRDNTVLCKLIICEGVQLIENSAFYCCSNLTSVTIPGSVTNIGNSAFSCCSSLTSVTIGNGVTTISDSVFMWCSSLTSVTIPDGVTSIDHSAFADCSSLTSVTIPSSVTSIGVSAFSGCSSLTSVTIPDGVTTIETVTFYGCSSLTSVTIPDSVTTIETLAFYGYDKLTEITFNGTMAKWKAIEKSNWHLGNTINIRCTDGVIENQ